MCTKLRVGLLAISLVCAFETAASLAAPPWSKVFSRNRVDADPDNMYPLTEDSGPWMVMATTFSGDGAEEQARSLVHELRSRYKMNAYTYQKKFDFGKEAVGRGIDKYGDPVKMKYQRGDVASEIAVLVGDFTDASDSNAQKVLRKIKYAQPESLKAETLGKTNQTLAGFRQMQAAFLPEGDDRKARGPMGHAFVTTNPLLPPEYFVPKGLDKIVVDMNKGIKHSLLNCKAKYTVKVATFTGQVVIDQKKIQEIESGKNFQSKLDDAASHAHKLTEALRKEGVEAYEFHDRYQSIVTIGAFNSVGTPRADGKIEINPAMHQIIQQYGAVTKVTPGKPQPDVGKPQTKKVAGGLTLAFDLSPIAVEVPRRSIAADYGRTAVN